MSQKRRHTHIIRTPLQRLRRDHPYPTHCPAIPTQFGESWFERGNALLLKKFLSPDMPDDVKRTPQLILELGVWKGRSTDFMLRVNATCTIICVDLWRGDDSIGHKSKHDESGGLRNDVEGGAVSKHDEGGAVSNDDEGRGLSDDNL